MVTRAGRQGFRNHQDRRGVGRLRGHVRWHMLSGVLPRPLGNATPNVVALEVNDPPPGRDIFVGYHRDLRRLKRLRMLLELVVARCAS